MKQIREQDPLKQGLKLEREEMDKLPQKIREQDPLKQGLKHTQKLDGYCTLITFASKIH